MPRRFDPTRALATPRSVLALIGPDPRVIADDVWAKLLWAGLNVEAGDLPGNASGPCYPIELIRAITLACLFAGQRSDEIARLRVGCIRWQHDGLPIPGDSDEVLVQYTVCLLDIPTHKTGTAFTKPVDPLLGKAIEAWQAVRPDQPPMLDRKTGEHANFLFALRARHVGKSYINATIIPSLCGKAGAAAAGEPWQYYDLGHGYCTYPFFEQCPHRMACARCDFYTPKNTSKGQLLEAKDNLQRMLANVPLTDDERAAVDDGQNALDQLLARLVDVPTPAGATPREIGIPATATLLPIVAVNHDNRDRLDK